MWDLATAMPMSMPTRVLEDLIPFSSNAEAPAPVALFGGVKLVLSEVVRSSVFISSGRSVATPAVVLASLSSSRSRR